MDEIHGGDPNSSSCGRSGDAHTRRLWKTECGSGRICPAAMRAQGNGLTSGAIEMMTQQRMLRRRPHGPRAKFRKRDAAIATGSTTKIDSAREGSERERRGYAKTESATPRLIAPQTHMLTNDRNSPPSSSILMPHFCSTRFPGNRKRSSRKVRAAICCLLSPHVRRATVVAL